MALSTERSFTTLKRGLVAASLALGALGLIAEVVNHRLHRLAFRPWIAFFSLSFEHNAPTWYASTLLFACALAVGSVASRVDRLGLPFRRRWRALSIIFGYLSLDEATEIHEYFGGTLRLGGALHFAWIIPASLLLVAFGVAYLRFVLALPRDARRRFVVAGVIYVGGALVMELPLGWWTSRHGAENLGYALIDWVEEMLELAGASLFLLAVLRHRATLPEPEPT